MAASDQALNKKLEKAYLSIVPPTSGPKKRIAFTFNPREYSISKSSSWQPTRQRSTEAGGEPQFTGSDPRTLDLEVFLDVTDSDTGSVAGDVEALFQCCEPTEESVRKNKPRPPTVVFGWGESITFTAYVTRVAAKFTMFRQNGDPVRATCSLSLTELPQSTPRQNPTSGSLVSHQSYTMVEGDTLASVAYREYGTPTLWRALAARNGIDDPMRVPSGTTLMVPPAEEAKGMA